MRSPRRTAIGHALAAAMLLPLLAGCPPRRPPAPPPPHLDDQPREVVMARVNQNTAAMDFLLRGRAVRATGRWNGERFELTGTLLHRQPRDLFLTLTHTFADGMDIGSNDIEFWVWMKLKERNYWWGEHALIDEHDIVPIPIRPDHLLDVLGFIEFPSPTAPDTPLFMVEAQRYRFVFTQERRVVTKAIDVDRQPPFLVREMVYFHPDGRPVLKAALSRYTTVGDSQVQAPQHIRMDWLQEDSWLELRFGRMERFDEPAAAQRFVSPLARGLDVGTVERVDGVVPGLPAVAHPPVEGPVAADLPAEDPATAPTGTPPAAVVSP